MTTARRIRRAAGGALGRPVAGLVYFVFDFSSTCRDLRRTALRAQGTPEGAEPQRTQKHGNIRYVDHLSGAGDAVLKSACRLHLEGIISKRLSAPYQSGRTENWTQIQMPRRP